MSSMFQDSDTEETGQFQPSRWKWMKLLPQQLYSSRKEQGEEEELQEVLSSMKSLRTDLNRVRLSMKRYLKCTKALAGAAKGLAEAVDTDKKVIREATEKMEPLLKDNAAYANLVKKISLVDELLVKEFKQLKFIRLNREQAERKLTQLRKKGIPNEQKEQQYLKTIQQATREHDELLGQMLQAMNAHVKEYEEKGIAELIKPQLEQFKVNQFQLFLNYQRLISGKGDKNVKELDKLWSGFSEGNGITAEAKQMENPERNELASKLVKQQSNDNFKELVIEDIEGEEEEDEEEEEEEEDDYDDDEDDAGYESEDDAAKESED